MTEALNALEAVMQAAIDGTATLDQFFAILTASQIIVPTVTEVKADGSGATPLIYSHDGVDMIIAFTDPARVGPDVRTDAQFELSVNAGLLIESMTPEVGLVLFGGPDFGFHFMPGQLAGVRATLEAAHSAGGD